MVDSQSAAAEIRRGIKKIEEDRRRKKPHGKNISLMSASATQAAIVICHCGNGIVAKSLREYITFV